MGQAKQRGTRDQRIAEALGLREISLSEVKKEYGLAEDADFLGYGVHIEKSDEFLALFEISDEIEKKAWAKTPELALKFDSIADAHDASKACKGSIVVGMFDVGEQIFVATITGVRPVN
jgi:hypothetical protein